LAASNSKQEEASKQHRWQQATANRRKHWNRIVGSKQEEASEAKQHRRQQTANKSKCNRQ
jgi:hypothetical protein